jgi:hypothetical protein
MPTKNLSRKQRAILKEMDSIFTLVGLDVWNIGSMRKSVRTPFLEVARRAVVRGEVISQYTLIDEHLSDVLCNYFFGWGISHIRRWRTKKFQRFNHFILQELPLLKKLGLVQVIRELPRGLANDIERINTLRNGMAHAFFPENLRRPRAAYKNHDIFSLDGLKIFLEDSSRIHKYFRRASRPEWS